MNNLKSLLLLLVAAISTNAAASRAISLPRTVTLQGGKQVTVKLVGDEKLHFLVAEDGKVVVQEGDQYRYATTFEQENIKAKSDLLVAESKARLSKLDNVQSIDEEGIYDRRPFPHTGTPRVLTILVEFPDYKFTYSKEQIDQVFNSTEYNTTGRFTSYGSVAQYFDDSSNGAFRPVFSLVGPYSLDKNATYYGKGDDNTTELLLDACKAAAADGVDFSEYDSDGDGYVDLVYVYYAGYGANWGGSDDFFWPKAGYNSGLSVTYNGKKLYRFGFNQELFAFPGVDKQLGLDYVPQAGIGVMVHEFSHCLGLPDFYPTLTWLDKNGEYDVEKYDNQSMEMWDLMDNGGNLNNGFDPIPYTAWEREVMGWTEKMPVLDSRCDVEQKPLVDGGNGVRIVNDNDYANSESWILENVPAGKQYGWYRSVPKSGMIVTHVDYDKRYFSNLTCPNNVLGHPRVTILPADGCLYSGYRSSLSAGNPNYMTQKQLNADLKGDPFPYSNGETVVNSLTDYKAYRGEMDKPITNIVRNDNGDITFKFMGGTLIMGDVNGDGAVTVADANAVVNHFLGTSDDVIDEEAADMNEDGEITVSDANAIVNKYLEKD